MNATTINLIKSLRQRILTEQDNIEICNKNIKESEKVIKETHSIIEKLKNE